MSLNRPFSIPLNSRRHGSATERIHVISVTTPSSPQIRSSANLLSSVDPETVTVAGSVAYVSTQNSLTAVSLADLDNPVPLPAAFLGSGSYFEVASIGNGLWASPTNTWSRPLRWP
ncbi:MAG: hypothetical protein ACKV19_18130 [Verrucomicrobiales bacterium]